MCAMLSTVKQAAWQQEEISQATRKNSSSEHRSPSGTHFTTHTPKQARINQ